MPKVCAAVKLAQAFVLIGLILSFIVAVLSLIFISDPIRNRVFFSFGMSLARFIGLALVLPTLIGKVYGPGPFGSRALCASPSFICFLL